MDSHKQISQSALAEQKRSPTDLAMKKNVLWYLTSQLKNKFKGKEILDKDIHKFITTAFSLNPLCVNLLGTLLDSVNKCIKDARLTKEQALDLTKRSIEIPCIREFADRLISTFASHPHWITSNQIPQEVEIKLDERFIRAGLASYAAGTCGRYVLVDDRVQIDERPVRRMDSLAKLFRLNPGLSVCNAVAVHRGELIISFNVSDKDAHQDIFKHTASRLRILQNYFTKVTSLNIEEYHVSAKEMHSATRLELAKVHPINFPQEIVEQALDKFCHAIFFDGETFPQHLKHVFRTEILKYKVLMPYIDGDNFYIQEIDSEDGFENHRLHLTPLREKCAGIKHAHAEQILARYVFDRGAAEYTPENPLLIGISKLPCKCCSKNLSYLPVMTRGEHGDLDENTVSLITDETINEGKRTTPVKRITYADTSPANSTKEPRHSSRISKTSTLEVKETSDIRRVLDFDASNDQQGTEFEIKTKTTTFTRTEVVIKQDDLRDIRSIIERTTSYREEVRLTKSTETPKRPAYVVQAGARAGAAGAPNLFATRSPRVQDVESDTETEDFSVPADAMAGAAGAPNLFATGNPRVQDVESDTESEEFYDAVEPPSKKSSLCNIL